MVSLPSLTAVKAHYAGFLVMAMLLRFQDTIAFTTYPAISLSGPSVHFQHGTTRESTRRSWPKRSFKTEPYPKMPKNVALSTSSSAVDEGNDKDKSRTTRRRPDWACDWMPTWLVTMRPAVQFLVGMALYVFHLAILTQHMIAFPFQLIPNDRGFFQSIGLDSVAGIVSLIGCMLLRRRTRNNPNPAVPCLWKGPTEKESPWQLPGAEYADNRKPGPLSKLYSFLYERVLAFRDLEAEDGDAVNATSILKIIFKPLQTSSISQSDWNNMTAPIRPGPRITSSLAAFLLTRAYFLTGTFGIFWEDTLYAAAGMGFPMTIAMHRSLCVLLGHLTWIFMGALILKLVPQPQPFFGGGYDHGVKQKWKWFTSEWDTQWLWWTMGGYFVSSWLFNVADFVNQLVLPSAILEGSAEGVVSQLINPENNDLAASLVGYIAPCITAPWWEEVLYRGFLLPATSLQLHFGWAVLFNGIIFSAHHLSATSAIPLAVLGWLWSAIYAKSGNLLVTILIHAMWNSRVFLGSWLGL